LSLPLRWSFGRTVAQAIAAAAIMLPGLWYLKSQKAQGKMKTGNGNEATGNRRKNVPRSSFAPVARCREIFSYIFLFTLSLD
jgi:hypothetical protein